MDKRLIAAILFLPLFLSLACDSKDIRITGQQIICDLTDNVWVQYTPEKEPLNTEQEFCADWMDPDVYEDWVAGISDINPYHADTPAEDPDAPETYSRQDCDGKNVVSITVGEAEIASNGNCRFLVQYESKSASKDVNLFFFDTHTNAATGVNQEWYRAATVFAGGNYSQYGTKFAEGDTDITNRVAVVFTPAACNWVGEDPASLDLIALEVANPCQ